MAAGDPFKSIRCWGQTTPLESRGKGWQGLNSRPDLSQPRNMVSNWVICHLALRLKGLGIFRIWITSRSQGISPYNIIKTIPVNELKSTHISSQSRPWIKWKTHKETKHTIPIFKDYHPPELPTIDRQPLLPKNTKKAEKNLGCKYEVNQIFTACLNGSAHLRNQAVRAQIGCWGGQQQTKWIDDYVKLYSGYITVAMTHDHFVLC